MSKITVNASKTYNVYIERGLLPKIGSYAADILAPRKAAIISDSNVWPLYGDIVSNSLTAAGFEICHYVFPAGEKSKNANTYLSALNYLAEQKVSRSDLLIALGGGVVGDMTGFLAATYMRGISYIQVPTTLLAMVDSSVGGKTAIDLPAGKNLVGAFCQPKLVLCDIDTADTLNDDVFCDGCAEIIKYGVLYDEALFEHLLSFGRDFNREYVISRCVELKRDVVALDEFDKGERQKLNLGHTIGHGIEAGSNFQISHGKAVAIGMAIVSKASANLGICSADTYARLVAALNKFDLPCTCKFESSTLCAYALSDKKRSGNQLNLIVPTQIGSCIIRPTLTDDLQSFIEAGL